MGAADLRRGSGGRADAAVALDLIPAGEEHFIVLRQLFNYYAINLTKMLHFYRYIINVSIKRGIQYIKNSTHEQKHEVTSCYINSVDGGHSDLLVPRRRYDQQSPASASTK